MKPSEEKGNSSSSGNTDSLTRKNIFIGDSRFHGMSNAVLDSSDEEWIYKDGAGYSWFQSMALAILDTKITSNEQYNVIINMGVNDFDNISSYISLYNNISEEKKVSKL